MLLDCRLKRHPPFLETVFKAGKAEEFAGAAWDSGHLGLMAFPSETWIVDFDKREITAGDGSGAPYRIATLTETDIRGVDRFRGEFVLNRLSGDLYIYRQADGNITIMDLKIPTSFSWTFRCSRISSPLA